MGTYGSAVTSCLMISCEKRGVNASGPTGSRVLGCNGGSSPKGRSGTRLYQLSGSALSSSKNFVVSTFTTSGVVAVSLSAFQASAYSLVSRHVGRRTRVGAKPAQRGTRKG